MKKTVVLITISLFALLLVGVVTCPDKKAHESAVKEELNGVVDKSMKEKLNVGDSDLEQGLAMLGSAFASNVFGSVLESNLKVHNYFVFSTGEMSFLGNKKTVSVGFLGHVFVGFDAEDLIKEIEENGK